MYRTGEKPGAGVYYCDECYHMIELKSDSKELPRCPICSATTFYKDEKKKDQK